MKLKKLLVLPIKQKFEYHASKILQHSLILMRNGLCNWQMIIMPDGGRKIALVFPVENWEIIENKIYLK